jgi:acylphosphatase
MSDAPNCLHGIVRGRVQRVGFRVFAREAALRHGINGWVRNLPDGRVEILAEGDELALTELLTDLYRGPILSHVSDIEITWKRVDVEYTSFEILR